MSHKGRPDKLIPQAARSGKRKRGSALIRAMNERDEALKAESTLSDQHRRTSEEERREKPQSEKEGQDQHTTERHPPLFDEKVESNPPPFQSSEEREKRSLSSQEEEETKHPDAQSKRTRATHEESILMKDPEEKLEKVTFYITLPQLEKLEDMVYEYKKRTKVRRANRNDIIRILIDQSSLTDLFK